MPVFNFQNHWLDWRFHFNNLVDAQNRNSNNTTDNNPRPVLSGYFWVYLIIATTLTAITVECWYMFTTRQQHTTRWLINPVIDLLKAVWNKIVMILKTLRKC